MTITHASPADLAALCAVEAACFPPAEAADEHTLRERLAVFPDHFWLLWEHGRLLSFVNSMATDEPDLRDQMYTNAALHRPDGRWQMIFGVDTIPARRREGLAGRLLRRVIEDTRAHGRRGLVLTCKQALTPYYAGFGFVNEGVSGSAHGGAVWYAMRLTL